MLAVIARPAVVGHVFPRQLFVVAVLIKNVRSSFLRGAG